MALAIAQGVASGADLGDGKGKTMTVDRTKTTMPQAVTALVEEALSVLCRHEKLAPLHAGLLLKLAAYVQNDDEGHARCRWGEGQFCYGGDSTSTSMSGESTAPRLELCLSLVLHVLFNSLTFQPMKYSDGKGQVYRD